MTEMPGAPEIKQDAKSDAALMAEERALTVSIIGTAFMGLAGVATAILSNSQAILLDGLFSAVGLAAAVFARSMRQQPDRIRPFGYGVDESIFTTFRALSLLGGVRRRGHGGRRGRAASCQLR